MIATALVMSCSVLFGQGVVSFELNPSASTISVGEEVCVDFDLKNLEYLSSLQFGFSYDETVLEFVSLESNTLPGFNSSNYFFDNAGLLSVSYEYLIGGNIVEVEVDEEPVFTVCFDALASTASTDLAISAIPMPLEIYSAGKRVKARYTSVEIEIAEVLEDDCPFDGIKLEIGEACGASGENVCIDVIADEFDGILSKQYSINYDPTVLAFTNAGDFILPNLFTDGFANPIPGFVTVSWVSNNLNEGETLEGSQKIYELCFDIIDEGAGSSTTYLSIGSTPTPIEVVSKENEFLDIWRIDGKVKINTPDCDNGQNPLGPLSFDIAEVEGFAGENVCVPIEVNGFYNLLLAEFTINYDDSALQYTGFNTLDFPNLNTSSVVMQSPGVLDINWYSNDIFEGTTVSNGTIFTELCFNILGAAGPAAINFSDNHDNTSILNNNSEVVQSDLENGLVIILDEEPSGFVLELSETCGELGEQVCVDLSGEQLVNLAGMQFSVSYDSTALNYTEVVFGALSGLEDSDFNLENPGLLNFVWLAENAIPVTVEDNEVLFSVCFEIISEEGSAVEIGTEGLELEVAVPVQLVDPTVINGSVEIGSDCEGDGTNNGGDDHLLKIDLGVESAGLGETVCLDVKAYGFNQIMSMQYAMEYNTNVLNFIGSQNYNLENLSAFNVNEPVDGVIVFGWFAEDVAAGETVPNATTIYELCFEVTGTFDYSEIKFSNNAFMEAEIVDYTLTEPDYTLDNGGVNFETLFGSDMGYGTPNEGMNLLYQNNPNPASGSTSVAFALREESIVEFNLFKENGLLIQSFSKVYEAGLNEIEIQDLNDPGVYYYTISTEYFSQGKQMIVVSH